ncbi:uncharacterized protein TNCV_2979161 [Trichonephila clavipes]|nr:uncharacterized protein TNCV_2979161 [Trichonephila clavipes]
MYPSQYTWPLGAEVHEQMSRSGGQSEVRPPVLKSPSKLGTHLSTHCSRDERMSRPCPAREYTRPCDEAHFWLNGYVNKQNCRIWSEANPQVYVETPLHPEKLTVWCALWAGGILLQKR